MFLWEDTYHALSWWSNFLPFDRRSALLKEALEQACKAVELIGEEILFWVRNDVTTYDTRKKLSSISQRFSS